MLILNKTIDCTERMKRANNDKPYHFFEKTYGEPALDQLRKTVDRAVTRASKQHDLRSDAEVYTPSVCRRGKLRYDIKLPPRAVSECKVLPNVEETIRKLLGNDYVSRPPHCLVAYGGAEAQPWHTDVDALFDDDGDYNRVRETPPFYLTLITALEDVTDEGMCPTEFEKDGFKDCLKSNKSVFFHGLVVHRGGASTIDRPPIVYRVFHRRWYIDVNERG